MMDKISFFKCVLDSLKYLKNINQVNLEDVKILHPKLPVYFILLVFTSFSNIPTKKIDAKTSHSQHFEMLDTYEGVCKIRRYSIHKR